MFKAAKPNILLLLATLVANMSCSSWTHKDAMRLFAEHMDTSVMRQEKIQEYLSPHSGVSLEDKKEVQFGLMEYSFVDKLKIFVPVEKKCRFIWVVKKDTSTITGWRYNSKPEYCTSNP